MSIIIETPNGTVTLPLTDKLLAAAIHWSELEVAVALEEISALTADGIAASSLVSSSLSSEAANLCRFATNLAALRATESEA